MVTQVFYSRNDLATYFGCSRDTILRYEREMRKLIPSGTYSEKDFSGTHIRRDAMHHYINRRTLIKNGAKVQPFMGR